MTQYKLKHTLEISRDHYFIAHLIGLVYSHYLYPKLSVLISPTHPQRRMVAQPMSQVKLITQPVIQLRNWSRNLWSKKFVIVSAVFLPPHFHFRTCGQSWQSGLFVSFSTCLYIHTFFYWLTRSHFKVSLCFVKFKLSFVTIEQYLSSNIIAYFHCWSLR